MANEEGIARVTFRVLCESLGHGESIYLVKVVDNSRVRDMMVFVLRWLVIIIACMRLFVVFSADTVSLDVVDIIDTIDITCSKFYSYQIPDTIIHHIQNPPLLHNTHTPFHIPDIKILKLSLCHLSIWWIPQMGRHPLTIYTIKLCPRRTLHSKRYTQWKGLWYRPYSCQKDIFKCRHTSFTKC